MLAAWPVVAAGCAGHGHLELLALPNLFDAFCLECEPSMNLRSCVESGTVDIRVHRDDCGECKDPVVTEPRQGVNRSASKLELQARDKQPGMYLCQVDSF